MPKYQLLSWLLCSSFETAIDLSIDTLGLSKCNVLYYEKIELIFSSYALMTIIRIGMA
jgi:hypothetical protein